MAYYYLLLASVPAFGVLVSYGAVDVLNHRILRLLLHRSGVIPTVYENFLDYCTKLALLRRVGDGYIFIHRLLLERFASMWDEGERGQTKDAVQSMIRLLRRILIYGSSLGSVAVAIISLFVLSRLPNGDGRDQIAGLQREIAALKSDTAAARSESKKAVEQARSAAAVAAKQATAAAVAAANAANAALERSRKR